MIVWHPEPRVNDRPEPRHRTAPVQQHRQVTTVWHHEGRRLRTLFARLG